MPAPSAPGIRRRPLPLPPLPSVPAAPRGVARLGMPAWRSRDRPAKWASRRPGRPARSRSPASGPCPRRPSQRRPCRAAAVRATAVAPGGGGRRHGAAARARGVPGAGSTPRRPGRRQRLLGVGALCRQRAGRPTACGSATASPGRRRRGDSAAASRHRSAPRWPCAPRVPRGPAVGSRLGGLGTLAIRGLRSCRRRLRGRSARRAVVRPQSRCRAAAWSSAWAKA